MAFSTQYFARANTGTTQLRATQLVFIRSSPDVYGANEKAESSLGQAVLARASATLS